MHRMTKDSLGTLLTETGHVLSVDDFDLVANLDKLALRVLDPLDSENEHLLSAPMCIGGQTIKPLTIGKALYIEEVISQIYCEDEQEYFYACAWAICEPHSALLWDVVDSKEIRAHVKQFMRSCKWRVDEAERLFKWLFPQSECDSKGDGIKAKYGPIVALLCREYGSTPEYWIHDAAPDVIAAMLSDYQRRQDAENRAASRASRGVKGKGAPSVGSFAPSLKGIALSRYNREVNRIRGLWQTTQQS